MKRIIALVACLEILAGGAAIRADDDPLAKMCENLKGIRTMSVMVPENAEQSICGMRAEQIKNLFTLELRKHKIPVQAEAPNIKEPGSHVVLVVRMVTMKKADLGGGLVFAPYSIQVQVWQLVNLPRNSNKEAIAATWISTNWVGCDIEDPGGVAREKFRSSLQSMAEEFAGDFLEANPPQN